jgi:hypothetical protein
MQPCCRRKRYLLIRINYRLTQYLLFVVVINSYQCTQHNMELKYNLNYRNAIYFALLTNVFTMRFNKLCFGNLLIILMPMRMSDL